MSPNRDCVETTPLLRNLGEPTNGCHLNNSNLVDLDGPNDPLNPQNLPQWRKWLCAITLGAMTFAVTFASAVFSAVTVEVAREFEVAPEVIALATSLFVFGFAMGPIVMGPASEAYGRKLPLFLGYLAFVFCQIPVATAQNVRTILIYRLLGGMASSGSPAIVGGYMADFLRPVERGVAISIFVATTMIGPCVGSIVGSIVLQSSLGWRWTAWISLILGFVFGLIGWVALPETYVPVLLKKKAQRLRLQTGNWALHSKSEESPVGIKDFTTRYITRPFVMLSQEPILVLMTLYVSFSFGMVYFLLVAYPFSFLRERGLTPVGASTPLIAVIIGIIIGSVYISRYTLTTYLRKFKERGKVVPEDRLPPMIVGAAVLPFGMFWFAWTSSPDMNPWPQIIAGIPIGAGIQIITLQNLAYVLDIYTVDANSAVSGTVIVRSLLAGLFPLIAIPMYGNLGVKWASSIVGLVGLIFLAVPILLYFNGAKIRSWSKYIPRT